MTLSDHKLTITLSEKDLSVWMAALRLAAISSRVPLIGAPCPFVVQHAELVRLTGYSAGDHLDLVDKVNAPGFSENRE